MEQLFTQLMSEMNLINKKMTHINSQIQAIQSDIQQLSYESHATDHQQSDMSQLKNDLHTKFQSLDNDLSFCLYRQFQAEKDIYFIKQHLELKK